jgi:mRNA-degrading endonuclease RelE of RelBE toxin-antitoxin system
VSGWAVRLTTSAVRGLDRLPPRIVPAVIELIYGRLAQDPWRTGKPLRGELTGLFSARRGEYRVLYEILEDSKSVIVHRIAHRREVYRRR